MTGNTKIFLIVWLFTLLMFLGLAPFIKEEPVFIPINPHDLDQDGVVTQEEIAILEGN